MSSLSTCSAVAGERSHLRVRKPCRELRMGVHGLGMLGRFRLWGAGVESLKGWSMVEVWNVEFRV